MRYRASLASICAVLLAVAIGCGGGKPKTNPTGGGGGDDGGGGTTAGGGGGDDGGGGGGGGGDTKPDPNNGKGGKTLFERLGGLPAIKAVVDEFVNRTTTDPRIMNRFFNTDA